jgi:predicted DNA-binding transcriptional regulator AlpA
MKLQTTPMMMSKGEVCTSLKISARTLDNMVKDGAFPPAVRLGKCKYWSTVAVEAWLRNYFAPQENWHL